MDPITVFDVPDWAMERMAHGERIKFLPILEVSTIPITDDPCNSILMHYVTVWAEPLRRKDQRTYMLFTNDDEWALKLRSELLAGQAGDSRRREHKAFLQGLMTGLRTY
jgi:hypothetical protein